METGVDDEEDTALNFPSKTYPATIKCDTSTFLQRMYNLRGDLHYEPDSQTSKAILNYAPSCSMGGVPMGNVVPMSATVYSTCSFQIPNVFLLSTLSDPLTPKGQMVVFEFLSGSHFLSLHLTFLIFLGLVILFDIYLDMYFFFPNVFENLEIFKGVKGKNKIGVVGIFFLIFDFLFQ